MPKLSNNSAQNQKFENGNAKAFRDTALSDIQNILPKIKHN